VNALDRLLDLMSPTGPMPPEATSWFANHTVGRPAMEAAWSEMGNAQRAGGIAIGVLLVLIPLCVGLLILALSKWSGRH
jgi:hypothetical protein